MHRATPLNTSFRAYSAGGARALVSKVTDGTLMQEMAGNFMKGESRTKIEAPQNYGFTSVVADATMGKDGQIEDSAEAFMSFIGGSRSFPVAGIMDDRRHRLKELEKGDTALFGLKEWGQQFHINKTGMFMSGNVDRRIRIGLVKNDDHNTGQQSGSGTPTATTTAETGGAGGQQQSAASKKGQKKLYDKDSETMFDMDKNKVTLRRGNGYTKVTDTAVSTEYKDDKIATRVDDQHVHLRFKDHRIFVDNDGCWSTGPINIKSDPTGNAIILPTVQELLARIVALEARIAALESR